MKEKLIAFMDIQGYEQDGEGLDFIDLNNNHKGEKLHFETERDLSFWIMRNFNP